MSVIQDQFQYSQLAQASYADLSGTVGNQSELLLHLDESNKSEYGGSFTSAQAAAFVEQWEVIDHLPNTDSGFSATVFRNRITGQYEFVIRGSEASFSDLGMTNELKGSASINF